jgi:hypothetical protein
MSDPRHDGPGGWPREHTHIPVTDTASASTRAKADTYYAANLARAKLQAERKEEQEGDGR